MWHVESFYASLLSDSPKPTQLDIKRPAVRVEAATSEILIQDDAQLAVFKDVDCLVSAKDEYRGDGNAQQETGKCDPFARALELGLVERKPGLFLVLEFLTQAGGGHCLFLDGRQGEGCGRVCVRGGAEGKSVVLRGRGPGARGAGCGGEEGCAEGHRGRGAGPRDGREGRVCDARSGRRAIEGGIRDRASRGAIRCVG